MSARQPPSLHVRIVRVVAIVLVPLCLIGLVFAPSFGGSKRRLAMTANRNAAVATLLTLAPKQREFHAFAFVDQDGDGIGEYATFGELAGTEVLRGSDHAAEPPFLPRAFGDLLAGGVVERQGYYFRIDLPTTDGAGLVVPCEHGTDPTPDPAESLWHAYAWPVEAGVTADTTLHVDREGKILAAVAEEGRYSGLESAPRYDAAILETRPGDFTAPTAAGARGNDGLLWESLGR